MRSPAATRQTSAAGAEGESSTRTNPPGAATSMPTDVGEDIMDLVTHLEHVLGYKLNVTMRQVGGTLAYTRI